MAAHTKVSITVHRKLSSGYKERKELICMAPKTNRRQLHFLRSLHKKLIVDSKYYPGEFAFSITQEKQEGSLTSMWEKIRAEKQTKNEISKSWKAACYRIWHLAAEIHSAEVTQKAESLLEIPEKTTHHYPRIKSSLLFHHGNLFRCGSRHCLRAAHKATRHRTYEAFEEFKISVWCKSYKLFISIILVHQ